ncbi:MAG: xanthine dehydrogenase family protein molybdopterin-binding subunit [Planctomycetes bacterium]|nr:xanthine dehydrogenase family protein molybdopterin-binding subunit [Planctomycetota bacterium]MBI3844061.1 xanthine dehydrogenase family protein molybdopterin-binding subunit [Planctomycetota bacterium]
MEKSQKLKLGFGDSFKDVDVTVPDTEPPIWDAKFKPKILGGRTPRIEGRDKVTGKAKYTYDQKPPGLLYGRILRCPHPHAKVKSVDASAAKALPGVKAVITFEGREINAAGEGGAAALAAESPRIADDAIRLIKVDYEVLPFVVDVEAAMKEDAPRVKKGPNSGAPRKPPMRGDVDKGFAESAAVIESNYTTQVQTHSSLETHGSVAKWDGDKLTVWASTQGTGAYREALAQELKLPAENVRVITEHMGGGFGSKFGPQFEGIIAARLAKEANAPVRLMLTRAEEHVDSGNRPSSVQHVKLGASKDGKFTSLDLKGYGTGGTGGGSSFSGPARRIYSIPNMQTEEHDVFINAGYAAAMRAPGHPQGSFALEQAIDELAEKLGMDPLQIRKLNDLNPIRLAEYDIGAKRIGWERRQKNPGSAPGPKKRGLGCGAAVWGAEGGPGAQVQARFYPDGKIEIRNGVQDIGTGTRTLMGLIAAEELGVPLSRITVMIGDTDFPPGVPSGGSQTAGSIAPTVRAAVVDAKNQLAAALAPKLGAKPEEIDVRDGKVWVKGATGPDLAAALAQVEPIVGKGEHSKNFATLYGGIAGAQFVEVEVDVETGFVSVIKVVAVHDCGTPINRLAIESQIVGGVIQGISYALFENRILDRNTGLMVNANLEDYKIAGSKDMPEIEPVIFDTANGLNSVGVFGLGEAANVPTAAAVANAIANATGVRVRDLPMTPDRVLAALAKKG